ncbi:O-acyltransferase like protein like [Argiope bruennichi]|uniref:O-acyltransferase like protein like n=1 Tax=Argiope bruennichi TaxID=94029 RepID=A0A8T0F0H7_ARGBR|nr:O-acyltransferase like protein like [Argiope bruennichi]
MADGILSGTLSFLGVYDQCLNISVPHAKNKNEVLYHGKYCTIEAVTPLPPKNKVYMLYDNLEALRNFSGTEVVKFLSSKAYLSYFWRYHIGVCIPSGCTEDDLSQLSQFASEYLLLDFQAPHCEIKKEKVEFSRIQVFTIFFCCFLGCLVLLGTWFDIRNKDGNTYYDRIFCRILLCFSLKSNFKRLVSTKTAANSLKCIHGFRFLSITWVVLAHSYFYSGWFSRSFSFLFHTEDMIKEPFGQMIFNGSEAVDSFFFMAGMLVCYVTLKYVKLEGKRFSLKAFLLHRFWRILPCMMHTWFISCEMQLFLMSLLVLLPMLKSEKIGVAINIFIIVVSAVYTGIITYAKKPLPTLSVMFPDPEFRSLGLWYTYGSPISRAGPYFIGFFIGFLILKYPDIKIPKKILIFGWCLAIVSSGTTIFIMAAWFNLRPPTPLEVLMYATFYKVAYTAGIAWMIFCCVTGHGGFINEFLSWKAWVPLSKLSFLIYLIQPIYQTLFIANFRIPNEFTHLHFITQFFGYLCISSLLAMILNLLVESPSLQLEKIIFETAVVKIEKKGIKNENEMLNDIPPITMNGKKDSTIETGFENKSFDSKI